MSRAKAKSAASRGSAAERTSRQPSPAAAAMRGPSAARRRRRAATPQAVALAGEMARGGGGVEQDQRAVAQPLGQRVRAAAAATLA